VNRVAPDTLEQGSKRKGLLAPVAQSQFGIRSAPALLGCSGCCSEAGTSDTLIETPDRSAHPVVAAQVGEPAGGDGIGPG